MKGKAEKYTPGPWRVDDTNGSHDILVADGELLATAYLMQPSRGSAAENARLIAAAPELLEALKGAVLSVEWRAGVMHGPHGINPDPEADEALARFATKCRAVIAKAEAKP